jgi:hypothetical protein
MRRRIPDDQDDYGFANTSKYSKDDKIHEENERYDNEEQVVSHCCVPVFGRCARDPFLRPRCDPPNPTIDTTGGVPNNLTGSCARYVIGQRNLLPARLSEDVGVRKIIPTNQRTNIFQYHDGEGELWAIPPVEGSRHGSKVVAML